MLLDSWIGLHIHLSTWLVTPTKTAHLSLPLVLPTLYLSSFLPQSITHTHTYTQSKISPLQVVVGKEDASRYDPRQVGTYVYLV